MRTRPVDEPGTFEDGLRGRAFVVAAAALWGTTGTAQALAPEAATPLAVGAVRMVVGGAALLALALMSGGVRPAPPRGPILIAGMAMAAYQLFFFAGVAATGVAVGTVVAIGSAPVLTGALAWTFRRDHLGMRWLAATTLAVSGCTLLLAGGRAAEVDPGGVVLALGAGASYAGYAVVSKGVLTRTSPLDAAAVTFGIAGLLLTPILFFVDLSWLGEPRGITVALELGLVATALAYVLFGRGLGQVAVSTAATLSLAEPLTAAVLAVVVVGERPTPTAGIGVSLILAGLIVVSTQGRRPR